ncbi:MAG: two-component system response regulator [Pseudomonadales bacterium]|nr:two-component system response regulator [Pseudomonadales bacterium]
MTVNKPTILVVDDAPENIDVLVGILHEDYEVKAAINGDIALRIARRSPPDLILLDIMMPGIDGYEVCRQLKEDHLLKHIPVIFITAKLGVKDEVKGFEAGAVDYISKPVSAPVVKARVRTHLALHDQNRELDRKVHEQTRKISDTRLQIIQRLGRAAEYKDNETGLHVIRMSHYSKLLALSVGMSENEAELLLNAAPMHDIGKIGIPDSILQKPGKLTEEEWVIMRTHCEVGARIIGHDDSALLRMARTVAMTHHERWDGTGYPHGLSGTDIPTVGRIVAVADVFDALTSHRPYKEAWPVSKARAVMLEASGSHFDPQMVEAFFDNLDDMLIVRDQYSELSAERRQATG